jgi:hypothetical protein
MRIGAIGREHMPAPLTAQNIDAELREYDAMLPTFADQAG